MGDRAHFARTNGKDESGCDSRLNRISLPRVRRTVKSRRGTWFINYLPTRKAARRAKRTRRGRDAGKRRKRAENGVKKDGGKSAKDGKSSGARRKRTSARVDRTLKDGNLRPRKREGHVRGRGMGRSRSGENSPSTTRAMDLRLRTSFFPSDFSNTPGEMLRPAAQAGNPLILGLTSRA